MLTSEDITRLLEKEDSVITGKVIKDIISDFTQKKSPQMKKYYDRFTGDVPIKKRTLKNESALEPINNKINVDHEGVIIDQIVGYIWGHEVKTTYNVDDVKIKAAVEDKIREISVRNNLSSLDEETGEFSCCCGYGTRLCYIDTEGEIRIMNTNPWETIIIYNNSTGEADYALIFYPWTYVEASGKVVKTEKVEFYDREAVSYWIKEGSKYRPEKASESGILNEALYQNPQKHLFDGVPVIKFKANNNEQSDLEKAIALIDAYNELTSDAQNEIQEFVHAYLKTVGAEINEQERIEARRSRVFNLPDKEADVDFIVKNINDSFFQNQKKQIKADIHLTTKTVDMNDEKFTAGGAESGEARKWKLLALEFKAIKKERKFSEGLRAMWKLIASNLKKTNFELDYLLLNFTFQRSLPIDFLYYAEIATKYRGTLPLEDILNLIPFVKDAKQVLERLEKENEVNLDNIPGENELNQMIQKILAEKNPEPGNAN